MPWCLLVKCCALRDYSQFSQVQLVAIEIRTKLPRNQEYKEAPLHHFILGIILKFFSDPFQLFLIYMWTIITSPVTGNILHQHTWLDVWILPFKNKYIQIFMQKQHLYVESLFMKKNINIKTDRSNMTTWFKSSFCSINILHTHTKTNTPHPGGSERKPKTT